MVVVGRRKLGCWILEFEKIYCQGKARVIGGDGFKWFQSTIPCQVVWRYRKSAEGSWSHHSLPHAAILPKVEGSSKSHWIVENTDMILWYWYERVLLWFKVRSILRSNLCKAKKKRVHLPQGLPVMRLKFGASYGPSQDGQGIAKKYQEMSRICGSCWSSCAHLLQDVYIYNLHIYIYIIWIHMILYQDIYIYVSHCTINI